MTKTQQQNWRVELAKKSLWSQTKPWRVAPSGLAVATREAKHLPGYQTKAKAIGLWGKRLVPCPPAQKLIFLRPSNKQLCLCLLSKSG